MTKKHKQTVLENLEPGTYLKLRFLLADIAKEIGRKEDIYYEVVDNNKIHELMDELLEGVGSALTTFVDRLPELTEKKGIH